MAVERDITRRRRFRRIISRDKPPCHWCGRELIFNGNHLDPGAFQVDHVIPLNKGGLDTIENCVASCRACNRERSDSMPLPPGVTFITSRTWKS